MINLILVTLAIAATNKDYPGYLDEMPTKKSCNEIKLFDECKDLSHYRSKDYIVFRWHNEATDCSIETKDKSDKCTWVNRYDQIMVRKGCLISWCGRNK